MAWAVPRRQDCDQRSYPPQVSLMSRMMPMVQSCVAQLAGLGLGSWYQLPQVMTWVEPDIWCNIQCLLFVHPHHDMQIQLCIDIATCRAAQEASHHVMAAETCMHFAILRKNAML